MKHKQNVERNQSNFGLRSSRPDRVNPLDRGTSKIKVLANFSIKIKGKLSFSLGLASAGARSVNNYCKLAKAPAPFLYKSIKKRVFSTIFYKKLPKP